MAKIVGQINIMLECLECSEPLHFFQEDSQWSNVSRLRVKTCKCSTQHNVQPTDTDTAQATPVSAIFTDREDCPNCGSKLMQFDGKRCLCASCAAAELDQLQSCVAALEQAIGGRAKVSEYQGSIIHALEEIINKARLLPDSWRSEASRGFSDVTKGIVNLCASELEQILAEHSAPVTPVSAGDPPNSCRCGEWPKESKWIHCPWCGEMLDYGKL